MAEEIELVAPMGMMLETLSYKNGMSVTAALAELIDNSLDAFAQAIDIQYLKKLCRFEIRDNGRGTEDVHAIVTPYVHRVHESTASGRFGIGGTVAQLYLTNAAGKAIVQSITSSTVSDITADYAKRPNGRVFAVKDSKPNDGQPTGTRIRLSNVRDLNPQNFAAVTRELSWRFAPALRNGVHIRLDVDGKASEWEPYSPPAMTLRRSFKVEVGNMTVKGFCGLVKPGEPNFVKGFAVAYGHRFLGKFSDPIPDDVDLGRIYGEIVLPREWPNISDHKDSFIDPPIAMWEKVAEACAPIFEKAEAEGSILLLDGAITAAQEILDSATGRKGVREKGPGGTGTVEGTGEGTPHANFKKSQPGDKPTAPNGRALDRIRIEWASSLDTATDIRCEGSRVRVLISRDHPAMAVYRGAESGIYLAHIALYALASDSQHLPKRYMHLFPGEEASQVHVKFTELLDRIHKHAPLAATA